MTGSIHICLTCLERDLARDREMDQLDFATAVEAVLSTMPEGKAFRVVRQSCLGMCAPDANVAVTGAGRWGWLFRGLRAKTDLDDFASFLRQWRAAPNGLPDKSTRPVGLRARTVGRLPPF